MKNEFAGVMSQRSDDELIKIVTTDREKYKPSAIEAAEAEVRNRRIEPEQYKKTEEKATQEKTLPQKMDENAVSSLTRFVNFIIDFAAWIVLAYFLGFILDSVLPYSNQVFFEVFSIIFIFGTFIAYYSILEIKYQKTLGKLVTKTKVVSLDGSRPGRSEIITRTLCRFIPFDRLSFLFTKNGLHDYLSHTKVVKDTDVL